MLLRFTQDGCAVLFAALHMQVSYRRQPFVRVFICCMLCPGGCLWHRPPRPIGYLTRHHDAICERASNGARRAGIDPLPMQTDPF